LPSGVYFIRINEDSEIILADKLIITEWLPPRCRIISLGLRNQNWDKIPYNTKILKK
jgi:hypothetical protein